MEPFVRFVLILSGIALKFKTQTCLIINSTLIIGDNVKLSHTRLPDKTNGDNSDFLRLLLYCHNNHNDNTI